MTKHDAEGAMPQREGVARVVAVLVGTTVAVVLNLGPGTAAADPPNQSDPSGAARSELGITKRDCAFSPVEVAGASTTAARISGAQQGTGFATIGTTLPQVTADVHLVNAVPNTAYSVRLIEVPTSTCSPGAPGVATGLIQTDPAGNGIVNLQTDVVPGTTGAWVAVLDGSGQVYTSNTVAAVNTDH